MLDVVGLSQRADRPVVGFSGGERQRLGLAQAMLHNPELLILDEPAAGLDPLGRRDVLVLLERLRERCTVVYSTHILDDVQRVSDSVAIIRDGAIIAQGPIGSMLAGRDGTTYHLEMAGDTTRVAADLRRLPWIAAVDGRVADGRGLVIGVPIAAVMLYDGVHAFARDLAGQLPFPWETTTVAVQLATGAPLSSAVPVVATLAWTAAAVVAACWRFEREQL